MQESLSAAQSGFVGGDQRDRRLGGDRGTDEREPIAQRATAEATA